MWLCALSVKSTDPDLLFELKGVDAERCNQCTIGYAMKIKKKKMFKSKHLVFAHFSTKTGGFFI